MPSKLANGVPTLQPSNGIVGICGEQLVQQLNHPGKLAARVIAIGGDLQNQRFRGTPEQRQLAPLLCIPQFTIEHQQLSQAHHRSGVFSVDLQSLPVGVLCFGEAAEIRQDAAEIIPVGGAVLVQLKGLFRGSGRFFHFAESLVRLAQLAVNFRSFGPRRLHLQQSWEGLFWPVKVDQRHRKTPLPLKVGAGGLFISRNGKAVLATGVFPAAKISS